MRAILFIFITIIGFGCHDAKAVSDCMGDNRFIYHEGDQLIPTTKFLPAGGTAEFVLKTAQTKANATYYVKFQAHYLYGAISGGSDNVTVEPIPANSPYLKSGLARKEDFLARVEVPSELATHWETVKVRLYGCTDPNSPAINSSVEMKVSSTTLSGLIVVVSVIILYFAATASLHSLFQRRQRERARQGEKALETASDDQPPPQSAQSTYSFFRFADPVVLTAGTDGKGSLSKLQILFFSVIVFGLLFYILLRTGELSDLSNTVMLLLGIAAIGATAGKGADQRSRLDFENYAWLIKKKWLPRDGLNGINEASWGDIVTSDGEFDVYRYQSCIFSLVVGGALVVVGVNQLASFEIPSTLLEVLGLSQVVYVSGKLVSPPAFADLNKSLSTLIGLENDLRAARAKIGPKTRFTDDAIHGDYEKYMMAAKTTAIMFASATGLQLPSEEKQKPTDEI
jgi:hypothetical protein